MDEIISRFRLEGTPVAVEAYGSGHINITRLVRTDAPHRYILQRVNRHIFRDVPALMENIHAVTRHLAVKDPDPRHVLKLVLTHDGMPYAVDAEGEYWRVYEYINGGICLNRAETADDFYQSAVAFGHFQMQLSDFPAHTLHETIVHFHDTPARFAALHAAAEKDTVGRCAGVEKELAFAYAQEAGAGVLMDLLHAGRLPLRVTHNDTKLNNCNFG